MLGVAGQDPSHSMPRLEDVDQGRSQTRRLPPMSIRRLTVESTSRRAPDPQMMPKFLKTLFPGLDKPDINIDGPLGALKAFFGGSAEPEASLTAAQIQLIRETWKAVEELGNETVGVLLFKNIFDAAPAATGLFSFLPAGFDPASSDYAKEPALVKHATGVVDTVGTAISLLDDLDTCTGMTYIGAPLLFFGGGCFASVYFRVIIKRWYERRTAHRAFDNVALDGASDTLAGGPAQKATAAVVKESSPTFAKDSEIVGSNFC